MTNGEKYKGNWKVLYNGKSWDTDSESGSPKQEYNEFYEDGKKFAAKIISPNAEKKLSEFYQRIENVAPPGHHDPKHREIIDIQDRKEEQAVVDLMKKITETRENIIELYCSVLDLETKALKEREEKSKKIEDPQEITGMPQDDTQKVDGNPKQED